MTRHIRFVLLTLGALVVTAPFLYMLSTSFKHDTAVFDVPPQFIPSDPTTENFSTAWTANDFARFFANSLIVATVSTFCTTVLAALAAYAFARFRFPGRAVLFWTMMLGLMVPGVMLLIPQFTVARTLQLTDTLSGLVVFYIGTGMAFNTFLLRGFFEQVPHELDEAMMIDGAGTVRRFTTLYLPLARPALATSAVLAFLASWDEYPWALTIINDPAKQTLPLAIAQFQGQHASSWGLVFAASVLSLIPVLVIYLLGQRHFVSGMQAGALK
ncbi:carbohydrate ABC transporter permease [Streptomyces sp. NPDC051776]|uniref:carbohydrate ABC transporter permease n=1 Tax=Streptomyces sp. NPDC051776 TaxID=3155414 RepID=UPI00341B296C